MRTYDKEQLEKKIKQDNFNDELNGHLDMINKLASGHWEFVLTYIQKQTTLRKVDHKGTSDTELAREYCMKSELNRVYKRLAQIE